MWRSQLRPTSAYLTDLNIHLLLTEVSAPPLFMLTYNHVTTCEDQIMTPHIQMTKIVHQIGRILFDILWSPPPTVLGERDLL